MAIKSIKVDTTTHPIVPEKVTDSAGTYTAQCPTLSANTYLEVTANKVTSISASSTDDQYPTAKAVYDLIPTTQSWANDASAPTGGTRKITVTPGAANRYIHLSASALVKSTDYILVGGDADLAAGNIKSGVSIFGVVGTYTGDQTAWTHYDTVTIDTDGVTFVSSAGIINTTEKLSGLKINASETLNDLTLYGTIKNATSDSGHITNLSGSLYIDDMVANGTGSVFCNNMQSVVGTGLTAPLGLVYGSDSTNWNVGVSSYGNTGGTAPVIDLKGTTYTIKSTAANAAVIDRVVFKSATINAWYSTAANVSTISNLGSIYGNIAGYLNITNIGGSSSSYTSSPGVLSIENIGTRYNTGEVNIHYNGYGGIKAGTINVTTNHNAGVINVTENYGGTINITDNFEDDYSRRAELNVTNNGSASDPALIYITNNNKAGTVQVYDNFGTITIDRVGYDDDGTVHILDVGPGGGSGTVQVDWVEADAEVDITNNLGTTNIASNKSAATINISQDSGTTNYVDWTIAQTSSAITFTFNG